MDVPEDAEMERVTKVELMKHMCKEKIVVLVIKRKKLLYMEHIMEEGRCQYCKFLRGKE